VADTIAARVAAGAAWLDKETPDWWHFIDLGKLQIDDCEQCVLGQLRCGLSLDDLNFDPALGFDASDGRKPSEIVAEFRKLTAEWKRVIEARRAGAAS
jgi:hypothetical protein